MLFTFPEPCQLKKGACIVLDAVRAHLINEIVLGALKVSNIIILLELLLSVVCFM